MKEWTVELYILDQDGKERPARCFTKVTYNLHPSFANPIQSKWTSEQPPVTSPHLCCISRARGRLTCRELSFQRSSLQMHQRGLG